MKRREAVAAWDPLPDCSTQISWASRCMVDRAAAAAASDLGVHRRLLASKSQQRSGSSSSNDSVHSKASTPTGKPALQSIVGNLAVPGEMRYGIGRTVGQRVQILHAHVSCAHVGPYRVYVPCHAWLSAIETYCMSATTLNALPGGMVSSCLRHASCFMGLTACGRAGGHTARTYSSWGQASSGVLRRMSTCPCSRGGCILRACGPARWRGRSSTTLH